LDHKLTSRLQTKSCAKWQIIKLAESTVRCSTRISPGTGALLDFHQ
jgi:ABC-type cobalamin transport system ATPase subunit